MQFLCTFGTVTVAAGGGAGFILHTVFAGVAAYSLGCFQRLQCFTALLLCSWWSHWSPAQTCPPSYSHSLPRSARSLLQILDLYSVATANGSIKEKRMGIQCISAPLLNNTFSYKVFWLKGDSKFVFVISSGLNNIGRVVHGFCLHRSTLLWWAQLSEWAHPAAGSMLTLHPQHSAASSVLFGQDVGKGGSCTNWRKKSKSFTAFSFAAHESTNLLKNIFLRVPPAAFHALLLAVTGAGRAALWPMQQVIPKHVFCLRVVPCALGVSPGHTAAPGAHIHAWPRVLWNQIKLTQISPFADQPHSNQWNELLWGSWEPTAPHTDWDGSP